MKTPHGSALLYFPTRGCDIRFSGRGVCIGCSVEFSRVITPVDDIQIWNASSGGFSFVISFESHSGPGLHGRPGFVASWRPVHQNRSAIKIIGSPFKTFTAAELACKDMLEYLMHER